MSTHCATERRSLDTMHQRSHFRNRRCLARCRRRLGRAFALKPAEEASSITFPIGGCGSRPQRPLPDRPPTLQAFRSDLSRTHSVSTQQLINGSRSYPRCHGVQSRRTSLLYHKLSSVVYNGVQHLVFLLVWVHVSPSNRNSWLLHHSLPHQWGPTLRGLCLPRYTLSTRRFSSARNRSASSFSPCITAYSSNASSRFISSIVSSLCGIAICTTFYCVTG